MLVSYCPHNWIRRFQRPPEPFSGSCDRHLPETTQVPASTGHRGATCECHDWLWVSGCGCFDSDMGPATRYAGALRLAGLRLSGAWAWQGRMTTELAGNPPSRLNQKREEPPNEKNHPEVALSYRGSDCRQFGADSSFDMARPERFELPTAWFVARYSIQLSYGRVSRVFCRILEIPVKPAAARRCVSNWRSERDSNPR